MKTRLTAAFVVGYDEDQGTHVIYRNGQLIFEDNSIVSAGPKDETPVDCEENLGTVLLGPGFVDLDLIGDFSHALIQSEMGSHTKTRLNWTLDYFQHRRAETMTPEEEAFKSLQAYLHGIQNGITTAMPITSVLYKRNGETEEEIEAAMNHAAQLGLRLYLSPSYISSKAVLEKDGTVGLRWIEQEGEEGLLQAVEFCRKYDGSHKGLIRACLTPERVEQMTPEVLQATRHYADVLKCPLRIHGAQSPFEYRALWKKHCKSPVEYLADIGFLGERALLVHGIWTTGYSGLAKQNLCEQPHDLDILRDTGTTLVHCPVVQAQSGIVLESFGRFLRHDVAMALATDTFPADMIQNIRIGSFLARNHDEDRAENSFANLYNAATCWAANALGRRDLGRLSPGAKADFIAIDLSNFAHGPLDDPIRTMVLACSGRDVKHSYINGRQIIKNFKFVDSSIQGQLDELRQRSQAYFDKFKQGYLVRSDQLEQAGSVFTPSFPIREETKK